MSQTQCSIPSCQRRRKYVHTGWCQTHYHRWWRTGSIEDVPAGARPTPVEDRGYRLSHVYVRELLGSATDSPCISCGEPANEWAYDGSDPDEKSEVLDGLYPVTFSVWPEFYMPMCFPCHRSRDGTNRAQRRTECARGHEMTAENTYTRPSRPGTRECKTCKSEESRRRYLRRRDLTRNEEAA